MNAGDSAGNRPPGQWVDDAALWNRLKTAPSSEAREALFELYFPFARQVARRNYKERSTGQVDFHDICQMASIGLLEAIDRYDPSYGVPFKGYAARRISGAILDGLAKASEVREQISTRNRMRRERAQSLAPTGKGRKEDALQNLMDLAVGLALGFMLDETNLYVADEKSDQMIDAYESLALKQLLRRVLNEASQLPDRYREVIRYHYINGLSFDQIARLMGLTKGRISQIHKGAIERLRSAIVGTTEK